MSPFVLEVREFLERRLSADEIAHRMNKDVAWVLQAISFLKQRQLG